MKIVVSDSKTKKAYSVETAEEMVFIGKKIREEVSLDKVGLEGYSAIITGGSDKQGFPMRFDVPGNNRRKVLLGGNPGYHPNVRGQRKRISVRGNVISNEISQVNVKISKYGGKALEEILGKKEEKKEEEKK